MSNTPPEHLSHRSDARRNRARILDAAREVFTTLPSDRSDATAAAHDQSMASIARRAGIGRGTLYRNFPGRRQLLEALFADEVAAVVAAAVPSPAEPAAALLEWLNRFATFEDTKHAIVAELLDYTEHCDPMFTSGRERVIAAGEPLLTAAQLAGQIRVDVTMAHALDLVLAVTHLDRAPQQLALILRVALDGLRVLTHADRPPS